ncbi:MAG: TIGR04255 family protein [Burkholderiales bacterium]|nr:TIGR04255 family protein [Burkholderiales bacterium]
MSADTRPKVVSLGHGGTSLGQLANAPLALVLAQVRFSPYLTIGSHIPTIQDALRKQYPAFSHEKIQTIEFGPTFGPPKVENEDLWNFTDAENREGFVVQRNSLIFIATKYETFEDFSERHAKLLTCFAGTIPDLLVERLGLRYVDLIVPNDGESPQEYVIPGLRGCEAQSLKAINFDSQAISRWVFPNGHLLFRYSTGVKPPFLPQDLGSIKLDNAEVVNRAERAKSNVASMDFDRIVNHKSPFNAKELSTLFKKMHDDLSTIFKQSRNKHAEEVWNSKP